MKKNHHFWILLSLIVAIQAAADMRPDANWERGYQTRLAAVVESGYPWPIDMSSDADAGKRAWSPLLANLWHDRHDSTKVRQWIETQGHELIFSQAPGSFYKPFSAPGYAMYYFLYKDRLPQDQREQVRNMLYDSGWEYLSRPDHHMDPIYKITEFNSENFNWMARLIGYLFAHEFNDEKWLDYFGAYVDNWIRALYNAGRVEWDSNIYFAYCFQPVLMLYDCAPTKKVKQQAKAALDWMLITAALKYLDGFQIGPDVRAKNHPYRPFDGSTWFYSYLYFADASYQPSFSQTAYLEHVKRQWVGFAAQSSYRPPQVAIDIAQRKYKTPVELQNAKPFYGLDHNNYADWRCDTETSRRFEFETLYLHDNYTLGSLATFRPSGNARMKTQGQMMFSEQSVWRLGVRGDSLGAIQVFGNAGDEYDAAGRCPYEQIGQVRNVMLRLMKTAFTSWIAIPEHRPVQRQNNSLYADLGHGVYLAVTAHNMRLMGQSKIDNSHTRFEWVDLAENDRLRGMALEVGNRREYGDFDAFIAAIRDNAAFQKIDGNTLEYIAASGQRLKIEYQPPTTYTLIDGTVIDPAGVIPRVWRDGNEVDFSTWDVYRVVSGQNIIEQSWGGGTLTARFDARGLRIQVNDETANVTFETITE